MSDLDLRNELQGKKDEIIALKEHIRFLQARESCFDHVEQQNFIYHDIMLYIDQINAEREKIDRAKKHIGILRNLVAERRKQLKK